MAAFRAIWQTGSAVLHMASEKHQGLIAAGVAFFGMFRIFPGLAAIIAIFGLMADPVVIADQLTLMADIIPADAYRLLQTQVNGLVNAPSQTLGWASVVSILVALWSCRAAVGAVIGMMLWLYVSAYLIPLGAVLNMHVYGKQAKVAEPA
ncbi:MAG: YihY/virulence factor BrkB family protein [Proteobacteria bacterium]|nr:YihY/virulence factor BrkB family protein [Pseudomonadota bacterium]